MDEQTLFESMQDTVEQMTEIKDVLELFQRGKNLKHLKTFRVLSVKLAHAMKDLRAETLVYEKETKAKLS